MQAITKAVSALKGVARSVTGKGHYSITPGYIHREKYNYFNDTVNTDNWQKEVYISAKNLCESHGLRKVVDVGCGSAFKLIQYMGAYECIGVDVEDTVKWLNEKYPERQWITFDAARNTTINADLVICSDVIEHVLDPDELLNFIKELNPEWIVISTPDRNLVPLQYRFGPPQNPTHIREWTFKEFNNYLSGFFDIIEHKISNKEQGTQMAICKRKKA